MVMYAVQDNVGKLRYHDHDELYQVYHWQLATQSHPVISTFTPCTIACNSQHISAKVPRAPQKTFGVSDLVEGGAQLEDCLENVRNELPVSARFNYEKFTCINSGIPED